MASPVDVQAIWPRAGAGVSAAQQQRVASARQVVILLVVLATTLLSAFLGRHVLIRVAGLYPAALPDNPYFVPHEALLLYVGAPAAVTACVAALVMPGVLFVLAIGGESRVGAFLLKSFGAAYALRVGAHSVALLTFADRLSFAWFAGLELVLDASLAALVIRRASRGTVRWPFGTRTEIRRLVTALVIPAVLVTTLLPLFFWQDFNGDGVEALEIGHSLSWYIVPRFPNPMGFGRVGAGMISMAVPVHWFVQLVGPIEAAARLPLALYLPVLYAALIELIEWNASRRLRFGEEAVLVLALATYAAAMCFNATYDPYVTDVASPSAFDTLSALCFAGSILYVWQRDVRWLLLFVAIGMFARPTELILLGALAIGVALVGNSRRAHLRTIAWGAALCVAIVLLNDGLWLRHVTGFAHFGGLKRWQYLTLTDVSRFLYVAVPGGLLPFLALALWNKQDREARQLTVACVIYFLLFYVQSFVALHHFVPAMLFPIAVFWRTRFRLHAPWVTGATAVATAACLWASLPRQFHMVRTARQVGCETSYTAGDDPNDRPSDPASVVQRDLLDALFILNQGVQPDRGLRLSAAQIYYYAMRCRADPATAQYIVLPAGAAPPAGTVRIAQNASASLFVRDVAAWQRERTRATLTDWRSPLFAISRATLHPGVGLAEGNYQLDLGRLPLVWRLFQPRRPTSNEAERARTGRSSAR